MNDIVKSSIDARKAAIFSSYNVTDKNLLTEINDFFKRLEEYASSFNDVMEFETSFASSPLSSEYTNLFTKIMTSGQPLEKEENLVASEIKEEINYQARRVSREATDSTLRNMPVVGDVIQARQTMDLFNKFRRKKDEDE